MPEKVKGKAAIRPVAVVFEVGGLVVEDAKGRESKAQCFANHSFKTMGGPCRRVPLAVSRLSSPTPLNNSSAQAPRQCNCALARTDFIGQQMGGKKREGKANGPTATGYLPTFDPIPSQIREFTGSRLLGKQQHDG